MLLCFNAVKMWCKLCHYAKQKQNYHSVIKILEINILCKVFFYFDNNNQQNSELDIHETLMIKSIDK